MKCCHFAFSLHDTHNTSSLAPHNHMAPPNFPTSGTKMKRVITQQVALLIMKNGGCTLTFAKVTNHRGSGLIIMYYLPIELKQLDHQVGA